MQFPITLETWVKEPDQVLSAVFAVDGPIADQMAGYRRNPTQIKYAKALAAAVIRGIDPAATGRLTAIAAGTGVGKSLAILIVSGINAALRGKRGLVTTFTRQLNRQLNGKDGRLAEQIISLVTGTEARVALRRPRSAFADSAACRVQADLIVEDIAENAYGVEDRMKIVKALRALADWTQAESEAAMDIDIESASERLDYVQGFRGLIESFFDINPDCRKIIEAIPHDLYTIDSGSDGISQAPYAVYKEHSAGATVLIATHAALIRDQSFYGITLDPTDIGYSSVIADEAHLLEKAGALALGYKRALSSYFTEIDQIRRVAKGASNPDTLNNLMDLAASQEKLSEVLAGQIGTLANSREFAVKGDEPWLDTLRALHRNAEAVMKSLKPLRKIAAQDLLDRMNQRHGDIELFFDVVSAAESGVNSGAGRERFYKANLNFSPRAAEPSVAIKPKNGARILSRLWSKAESARADAIILTSATLGRPRRDGTNDTKRLFEKIGAGWTHSHRVNTDLEAHFEVANLGKLEALLIAHPSAPTPTSQNEDDPGRLDPSWVQFATNCITVASEDRYKQTTNRVVVLCTSYEEAHHLGNLLDAQVPVHVRNRDEPLDAGFDWLTSVDEGVLITVGAHDGVDRPGLIDHLVMPRLPFQQNSSKIAKDEVNIRDVVDEMMMALQQGFGRAFRSVNDRAKVWILDPRIGVPAALSSTRAHPKSQPYYLDAIPDRFRLQLADTIMLGSPDTGRPNVEIDAPTPPARRLH